MRIGAGVSGSVEDSFGITTTTTRTTTATNGLALKDQTRDTPLFKGYKETYTIAGRGTHRDAPLLEGAQRNTSLLKVHKER